jgi:hypothetical protein
MCSRPPLPQSVTPTERIILDADLDEHLESRMQDYWQNRIEEKRGRVRKLVKLLTEDSVPLSDERFSAELGEVLGSRLPAGVEQSPGRPDRLTVPAERSGDVVQRLTRQINGSTMDQNPATRRRKAPLNHPGIFLSKWMIHYPVVGGP